MRVNNGYRNYQVIIKFTSTDVKSCWYSEDDIFYDRRYYGDFKITWFIEIL